MFRGTPLLARIILVAYSPPVLNAWLESVGLPLIDFTWRILLLDASGRLSLVLDSRILLCAITLGLNSAAYQAEFFR